MMLSPAALEKYGKDFGQHPVGTGPFMLKELAAGKSVIFEKFPDYWNKGEPKLDAIEFRVIRNATSLVSALQSGQLDYAANIDPINMPVLQRNSNLRVGVEPTIAFGIINLNSGTPPLNDVRVRRAIAIGDRSAGTRKCRVWRRRQGAAGEPAVATELLAEHAALEKQFTYRPEEAKKLLAEAGYPDEHHFQSVRARIRRHASARAETRRHHARANEAGGDQGGFAAGREQRRVCRLVQQEISADVLATWSGRPDPAITYSQVLGTVTAYNVGQTKFGDAEDVIAQLYATSDRDEQKKLFDQLNQLWIDYVPMITLYYYVNVVAYNAKLAGEQPNLLGRPYVRTLSFNK